MNVDDCNLNVNPESGAVIYQFMKSWNSLHPSSIPRKVEIKAGKE